MLINQPSCSLFSPANPRLRISAPRIGFLTLGCIFTKLFLDLTWSWWHFPKYNKRLTLCISWIIKFTGLFLRGMWQWGSLKSKNPAESWSNWHMQTGDQGRAGAPILIRAPFLHRFCPQLLPLPWTLFRVGEENGWGFGKPIRHCLSNPGTNNRKLDIHGVPLCPSLLGIALIMLCQHNYSYDPFKVASVGEIIWWH